MLGTARAVSIQFIAAPVELTKLIRLDPINDNLSILRQGHQRDKNVRVSAWLLAGKLSELFDHGFELCACPTFLVLNLRILTQKRSDYDSFSGERCWARIILGDG